MVVASTGSCTKELERVQAREGVKRGCTTLGSMFVPSVNAPCRLFALRGRSGPDCSAAHSLSILRERCIIAFVVMYAGIDEVVARS